MLFFCLLSFSFSILPSFSISLILSILYSLFSLISLPAFQMCLLFLFPHSTFYIFFPLLPSNTCFHFSFFLSPQVLPAVSRSFDSLPSSLFICVFFPFTQFYIHLSSFCSQSFHFFTGIYSFLW
jgi:hypothetical protein